LSTTAAWRIFAEGSPYSTLPRNIFSSGLKWPDFTIEKNFGASPSATPLPSSALPDAAGGPDLRGAFVVRVSDRLTAIAVVQSKMPDAMVQIDSETSPEVFEKYYVKPGEVFVLLEGK
jgi:hypothetical protein